MRGYQADFYTLNEGVRDILARQHKAAKIAWALSQHSERPLAASIILDVGCSAGLMTAAWAPLCSQTIGVDYDAVALAQVKPEVQRQVNFVRSDAMCLPFPDNCIDAVICAQVYEHVPSDLQLFLEIYRVLRPGGVVFFSGPNWLFPIEPHYFLPFLHWLPAPCSDLYLRLFGLGDHYYERSRPIWHLHKMLELFEIYDLTRDLLGQGFLMQSLSVEQAFAALPAWCWALLVPFLPNFNWILRKSFRDQVNDEMA